MAGKRNFSEYTRLRDIAHKRAVRLEKSGFTGRIDIPTVADIKAGRVSEAEAMSAIKNFLSEGSTLTAVKQTQLVPEFKQFNLPSNREQKSKLTDEQKRERKRERDRAYRRRKAVRETAKTSEQAAKREGYLKALETVANRWKGAGLDLGIDLKNMTPAQARAFVAYMDYRFSQGDFAQHYVINDFIQDFSKLLRKGYKAEDITADFDKFLADQARLERNADNMIGISPERNQSLWDRFIHSDEDDEDDELPF